MGSVYIERKKKDTVDMTLRTRFAPSPTGYLHIGGVRTALFNWLLSQQAGGQFILRIDDTDAERHRPEALQPILDGFRWLGILWDEGPEVGGPHAPYFQSQRAELYSKAALKLIETGRAYPDYATKEQLEADRMKQGMDDLYRQNPNPSDKEIEDTKKAIKDGKRKHIYRGQGRNLAAAENLRLYRETPGTVRFKIRAGRTVAIAL